MLESKDPAIRFFAVRSEGDRTAFRVWEQEAAREGPDSGEGWYRFVERNADEDFRSALSSSELTSLFIESGLLKGGRRKVYGKVADSAVHAAGGDAGRFLFRRFLQADDQEHLSHHMSVFRISDSAWYLQEVAAGPFREAPISALRDRVMSRLREETRFAPGSPEFLAIMYSPSISAAARIWSDLKSAPGAMTVPALHLSLTGDSVPIGQVVWKNWDQ
jgi:hypothetical protein